MIDHFHQFYVHPGMNKMVTMIHRFFGWPGLRNDVYFFCKNCTDCKLVKTRKARLFGPSKPILSSRPRELIGVDFSGQLPVSKFGCTIILVVMDHFSKYVKLYPMKSAIADNTFNAVNRFIDFIGGPIEKILSDNCPQFSSKRWREYWPTRSVQTIFTSFYTPEL